MSPELCPDHNSNKETFIATSLTAPPAAELSAVSNEPTVNRNVACYSLAKRLLVKIAVLGARQFLDLAFASQNFSPLDSAELRHPSYRRRRVSCEVDWANAKRQCERDGRHANATCALNRNSRPKGRIRDGPGTGGNRGRPASPDKGAKALSGSPTNQRRWGSLGPRVIRNSIFVPSITFPVTAAAYVAIMKFAPGGCHDDDRKTD